MNNTTLDLSVQELPGVDLSVRELEQLTTPDVGDFMTGVTQGLAISGVVVATIGLT